MRKVAGDLGSLSSTDAVRVKMLELLAVAKAELMNEF